MKVLLQRVSSASVEANGTIEAKIDNGVLLLVGIAAEDNEEHLAWVADKCVNLRIFEDGQGKMNRSVLDIKGEILVVSQFTLLADTRKGRRPSYINAANPEKGEKYYNMFIELLNAYDLKVESGIFGAMMNIELLNRGPVTIIIEK